MPDNQQMPVAEWLAEGKRRFGEDSKLWQFRCPVCGNIQTMQEFKQLGADPQSAYQECIGRHLPSRASNLAGTPAKDGKKSPCDYAAYGLFQFGWKVINEAGKAVPVFPFADSPTGIETILVTGPLKARLAFLTATPFVTVPRGRTGQTCRYTCEVEVLEHLKRVAQRVGVTVQQCVEGYPVLYLAKHQMKWEAER